MNRKKAVSMLAVLSLLIFCSTAIGQESETIEMVVNVDASDSSTHNYNQEEPKYRGMPFATQTPVTNTKAEHYDRARDKSPQFVSEETMKGVRTHFSRAQLEQILKSCPSDKLWAQNVSLMETSLPAEMRSLNDMLHIITADNKGYKGRVFLNGDLGTIYSDDRFIDSWHLIAWLGIECLNSGYNVLRVYGDGWDKFFQVKGFNVGLGASMIQMSGNEDTAGTASPGLSFGKGRGRYVLPPHMRIEAGKLIPKDQLEYWWQAYSYLEPCSQGDFYSPPRYFHPSAPLEGMNFHDMVDLMLIEDYILGQRFANNCRPPEWMMEEKAEKIPESAREEARTPKEGTGAGQLQISGEMINQIFFNFDESNIRQSEAEKLKKAKTYITANAQTIRQEGKKIIIVGTASKEGSAEYNAQLSRKRALEVQRHLLNAAVAGGLSQEQAENTILIVYAGEDTSLYQQAEKNRLAAIIAIVIGETE
jgi:outer membrane protein OmpA-like peptidoglycan-associated protein